MKGFIKEDLLDKARLNGFKLKKLADGKDKGVKIKEALKITDD